MTFKRFLKNEHVKVLVNSLLNQGKSKILKLDQRAFKKVGFYGQFNKDLGERQIRNKIS